MFTTIAIATDDSAGWGARDSAAFASDSAARLGRAIKRAVVKALVPADFVEPDSDGSYSGEIALTGAVDSVVIDLLDHLGLIVESKTLGPSEGMIRFRWTGVLGVNGRLRVRVKAERGGQPVATTTYVWGAVVNPVQLARKGSRAAQAA